MNFPAQEKVSAEFKQHRIHGEMDQSAEFYEILGDLVSGGVSMTWAFIGNIDTQFFAALSGTIESMKAVLQVGRVADAYTLLRRFREAGLLQLYFMVRIAERKERFADISWDLDGEDFLAQLEREALDGLWVTEIEDWLTGQARSPAVRCLSKKIKESPACKQLNSLFDGGLYKQIVDRLNDHVHTNFFLNLRTNDLSASFELQMTMLEMFAHDFRHIVIQHVAYVFSFHGEYMASSDFVDHLELGLEPPIDSQYSVAPFIQKMFDDIVTRYRPDVTEILKQTLQPMDLR